MYVGGLDEKVSEPLLWELFLQAGPVVNTHMPKDRVTGQHQGEGPEMAPRESWGWDWDWKRGIIRCPSGGVGGPEFKLSGD